MKIVHLCLSCFYIDGYAYQENELVAQNVVDGHDVLVIASTETFGADRRLTYLNPGKYLGTDGAMVIRLPYRSWLPHFLMRKLRAHPGVYALLEEEKPDVILFHGLCGWELTAAAKYRKAHPYTKLYVDSHEDFNNSARSFVSRYVLHSAYYRPIARYCLAAIDKILCISVDTINFVCDYYKFPSSKIEFYPLGGKVFVDSDFYEIRLATREQYEIETDQVLFVQSGKIDRTKKLLESLHAFLEVNDPRFYFIIVGHLQDEISAEVESLINNDVRIRFVGWKTPDELRRLLCAADIYVQPGTQSATMQMSLCCRCAVILEDVPSHKPFVDGNGWLIGKQLSLDEAFNEVAMANDSLQLMSTQSAAIAARLLDYKSLAARLYR
jgi:glycosyltransferase involved in cell wall biosynthesis